MNIDKTVLPNGLRIVTSRLPYTHSVSIGIFIAAGSRYERDSEAGVAHFAEHLLFKGTEKRKTAREISEAIESVGGLLNGGTDKELTVLWSKVARPHFALAQDILIDILLHSRFDPVEMEKERRVIIEEINMGLDSPSMRVQLLIDEVLWPAHPLGRDVAGTRETVLRLTREDVLGFISRQYSPKRTVVGVAGDIEHEEVVSLLGEVLATWEGSDPQPCLSIAQVQESPRIKVENKDTEQVHLCLALPGLSYTHPDRFALDLLNIILGEGMSSRLFQEIREKKGLAYEVNSYIHYLQDGGSWVITAGLDPGWVAEALEAILVELGKLRDGVPERELVKAKEYFKGRMWLRLEDTRSVVGWLGVQESFAGRILSPEQVEQIIDSLSTEDLQRVACDIIRPERLNLAAVGPVAEDLLSERLKL